MTDNTDKNSKGSTVQIKHFLEGKNEVPLEKRGYNDTPAGKIERPKPSPPPPPPANKESK
jgi:hypothetical protein